VIGGTLAGARDRAGMSVSQVSQRTRIRETIIREIERDDYSSCGGDFYARGHIRAIARVVGVDPGPLIADYDAAHGESGGPVTESGAGRSPETDENTVPDLGTGGLSTIGLGAAERGAADRDAAGRGAAGRGAAGRGAADRGAAGRGAADRGAAGRGAADRGPDGPGLVAGASPQPDGPAGHVPAGPGHGGSASRPSARPVWPVLETRRRRPSWTVVLALLLVAVVALLGYYLFSGPSARGTSPAAGPGSSGPSRPGPSSPAPSSPASSPAASQPPTVPVQALAPASAVAFGPGGVSQGDNPQRAALAIDGGPATFWHTNWYTTARFGGLKGGTGLLLDMGKPVVITSAQITLGSAAGASLQLRVGNVPALADLRPVASASDAGGVLRLQPGHPARARYLLIWFTRLPPDPAGTFQASISGIRLKGST
jgi:hypothetical protein